MDSVTGTLLAAFLCTFLLYCFRWVAHRHNKLQVLKQYGIPGPKPNFFDGNFWDFKREPNPHNIVDEWLAKYGNVFGFYKGEVPYIMVNDLEMIKQIAIKDFSLFINRPDIYMNLHPFSKTLLGLKDHRWKDVRTIISPAFSASKLKLMKDIFDKKVDITVEVVSKKAQSNEMFDILKVVQALTLDVIADCALAMKIRCQENPKDKLLLALQEVNKNGDSPAFIYGEMFPFIKPFFTFIVNNFSVLAKMNSVILGHEAQALSERLKNPQFKSRDVLQLFLDGRDEGSNKSIKMTDEEVIANAYVVLLGGFETTASCLAFTFHLLVQHQDIQERLFREIDAAPDSSYATLQGLQYLGQVVDESLRLYPPITDFVNRVCKEDYKIGSYTFPKDSVVAIPVWQIHHNPDFYPDPCKFDPDRFSPENAKNNKSSSFLAFGVGPRNCIGSRFALLEVKLALFKLLKHFKFVPCEKTKKDISFTTPSFALSIEGGVWVKAVPRKDIN